MFNIQVKNFHVWLQHVWGVQQSWVSQAFSPLCLLVCRSWAKLCFAVKCLKLIKWYSIRSWFQSFFPQQHFANCDNPSGENQEEIEPPLTDFSYAPGKKNPVFWKCSPIKNCLPNINCVRQALPSLKCELCSYPVLGA